MKKIQPSERISNQIFELLENGCKDDENFMSSLIKMSIKSPNRFMKNMNDFQKEIYPDMMLSICLLMAFMKTCVLLWVQRKPFSAPGASFQMDVRYYYILH